MHRSMPTSPKQEAHESALNEMHDALYTLGSKARAQDVGSGGKLLPKGIAPKEQAGSKAAKKHIHKLHKAFKAARKGK